MPQLAFPTQTVTPSQWLSVLENDDIDALCRVNDTSSNQAVMAGKFFTLETDPASREILIHLKHLPMKDQQVLNQVTQCCGDETLALAGFLSRYFSEQNITKLNTVIGSAATAASARLDAFETAVVNYQKALNHLWSLSHNNHIGRGHAARIHKARLEVKKAYQQLQHRFTIELRRYAPEAWRAKNRGDAFSNSERGITLATRNPKSQTKDVRLNLESRLQASQLKVMSRLINHAGNMAIGLDASLRALKVMDIQEDGGDWMRESARQITGFGFGGAAGLIMGRATFFAGTSAAAASGLTLAGPVGWIVLGTLFVGSLVAGYYAGSYGDQVGQGIANGILVR
ncbi:MAG: hypothetical protein P8104_05195 [Gammaproteobacteria bacterium]